MKPPAVFGREDFGDGAAKTLCYVLDELVSRSRATAIVLADIPLRVCLHCGAGIRRMSFPLSLEPHHLYGSLSG